MNFDNKVPISVEAHTVLDLPCDHATTSMFMLLQPMYYRHTLKTERISASFTSVVRPNPLAVPSFGRVRQNLRHFFVPYRQIFPNWEEFVSDVIASNADASSQVVSVPFFYAEQLCHLFFDFNDPNNPLLGTKYGLSVDVPSPSDSPRNYDFKYGSHSFKLTRLGRNFYKVLYSLGYAIVGNSKTFVFNALALLGYAKVYCDWYANSQYLNDATYLSLQRYFKYNDPTTPLELLALDLYRILLFVRPAVYDSNPYFEDAWDNPVSPNSGNYTGFSFSDPTSNNGAFVSNNSLGSPEMFQNTASDATIGTKYLHDALQKLSEYQKRHALSGARAIDRVLAEYGIQTDYLKSQRSIYVGVSSLDVEINSIFATANGSNSAGDSVVGDYAGAGIGRGQSVMDFQNDEEGIFLTISTIQPSGGYYQGYDRINRAITKWQFYQPSADALGVQSIEKGEVYVSNDLDSFISSADDYAGHYGFTGRYGERKRPINRVSGDFSFPSVLQGGNSWHLMREFNDRYFNNSVANIVHSEDFARGTDAEQYLRLFTYTEYDIDPFNVFLHVECSSHAPCHPLTDSFIWDSDAEKVAINSNGPKVN